MPPLSGSEEPDLLTDTRFFIKRENDVAYTE